jgi:hypothetical protein
MYSVVDGIRMVTIPLEEYEGLIDVSNFMIELNCYGVEKWEGYMEAVDGYRNWMKQ